MNLEDKINAPIPTTVDPLESLANGDKRRKGDNAGTLAMPRKGKKSDAGKSSGRKGPKKALMFDGPADNSLGLANLVKIKSDTAMARVLAAPANDAPPPVIIAPAESQSAPDLVPTVAAPAVEAVEAVEAPMPPTMAAAPAGEESAPPVEAAAPSLGEAKSSVFMVATLQINEPAAPAEADASTDEPAAVMAAPAIEEFVTPVADAVTPFDEPAAPATLETATAEAADEAPATIVQPVAEIPAAETVPEQAVAPEPEPVATPIDEPAPGPAPAPMPTVTAVVKQPRRLAIPAAEAVSPPAEVETPKQVVFATVKPASTEDPVAEAPAPSASTPISRSEAIARAARAKALSGAGAKAPSPEVLLQAARAEAELRRAAEQAKQPTDLYGYWTRAKNGRRFPARGDFDAEQVAENWPNSMLLTCGATAGNGNVNITQVLRLGAGRRSRPSEELNFTSMITEWMLTIGGEAARAGQPVQDSETFRTPEGTHAYKIVALPLGEQPTRVDHVLCQLTRS